MSKETLLHKYWSSSFKSALEKSPEAASAVVKRAQKLGVNIATSTADDISLKLMKNGATTKLVEKGFNASFGMIGFGTKIADFGAKKISFGTGTKIGTAIEKNLGITLETNVAKFAKGSAVVGTLALIGYAGYKIKKSFDDHYVDSGPNNYLAQEKTQDFFKNFRPEKSTIKEGYSKVNIIGNDSRILVDDKLGLPIRVKVGADGTPLIIDGQPIPDPYGSFARVKIDDNGNPLMDSNGNYVFEKKNIDSLNVEKYINKESLALNKNKELLLIDKETGNPLTFRSDENGNPIFDEKGDLIQDPNGINLAIQIDNNGKPLKINGEYVFVNPSKQEDSKLPHSMERYLTGVTNKSFAKQIVGFASEKMISGASVLVPFTGGKTIGFGLKHEVSKTVTEILSKPNAFTKKASDVLVKDVFRDIPKYTIRNSKQFLESSQLYGKGVQSLSLKEAGQAAGGKIKAIRKSASEMTEVITNIAKTTSKEGIKEGGKAAYSTLSKTVVGSTEKALVEGLEKGLEKGVKSASKKIGKEALEKSLTSAANREVTVALEKATVKYATKTSSKIGSRLAGAIPVIGVTAGVAITAWDTKDAIEKSKDKNASVASKALAWTTVGLDVVSTGADASGVGAPIGVVASVAGIGTSILSDYLR